MKGPIALVFAGALTACSSQAQSAAGPTALGVPVYPGATADARGIVTASDRESTRVMAGFSTRDHFADVDSFYERELPAGSRQLHVVTSNGSVSTFRIGGAKSRDRIAVSVTVSKPSETDILITRVTENGRGG